VSWIYDAVLVGRAGFEFAELKARLAPALLRHTGFCFTGLILRVVRLIGWVMPTIVVGVYSVSVDELKLVNTEALPS